MRSKSHRAGLSKGNNRSGTLVSQGRNGKRLFCSDAGWSGITGKLLPNVLRLETMQQHGLVPGSVAANQLHPVAGAPQFFREKFRQRFVRGGVHGRRGDFDFQLPAERRADLVRGGAGLKFDGQPHTFGVDA